MSIVRVTLTHSISKNYVPEKRFALTQTIESVKVNIATHFATPADHMRLELRDDKGVTIETNMLDEKMLGYYQCRDEFTIHVVDLQPVAQVENFDDVSKVQKFEISEEAYSQRKDNVRDFKARMLAQQRAEMVANGIEIPVELNDDSYKEEAEKIHVGDRCQCAPGERLGTVRYVGRIGALKAGWWIGVEFDEPVGKGDGSVKGHKVFTCRPGYGGFLRPEHVEVGDFPEEEF
ncbi:tubulin-specific chaperone, putative [Bodo saltans]|uniref:Tubulin-specific chaperone, putative n=1 Tax=Bodo saltans TaxID=75058 RepID=A0A0S4JE98_BODSA|nr:tubulin-specific chaperone, putative [Bodo saltans]|eukprot:CUG88448.1 tubulin-specific chaperone, putative [Bodo saltans]